MSAARKPRGGDGPRWKPPRAEEIGIDPEEDPEGWEWRRRRLTAMSRLDHLMRHGTPMVAFLSAKEVLDRTDPKPRVGAEDVGAALRPVAVQIIVQAAQSAVGEGGVTLRLGSGDGAAG